MAKQDDKMDGNADPGCDPSSLRAAVETEPVPPRLRLLARQLQQALLAARKLH